MSDARYAGMRRARIREKCNIAALATRAVELTGASPVVETMHQPGGLVTCRRAEPPTAALGRHYGMIPLASRDERQRVGLGNTPEREVSDRHGALLRCASTSARDRNRPQGGRGRRAPKCRARRRDGADRRAFSGGVARTPNSGTRNPCGHSSRPAETIGCGMRRYSMVYDVSQGATPSRQKSRAQTADLRGVHGALSIPCGHSAASTGTDSQPLVPL
jgi:hypothetical protein